MHRSYASRCTLRTPTPVDSSSGCLLRIHSNGTSCLSKHYRLHSNLTVDHTVQFDTDCGTLGADSGASHFLWDPESGRCSISSGLTSAEFSVSDQQDYKTSFYYVRDYALVVPPGSPNCPTHGQLKQMIDNLRSLNGSFMVETDPTRRTWRSACIKSVSDDATATATAYAASPTNTDSPNADVTSVTAPVTTTGRTPVKTSSSTVEVGPTKTYPSATIAATSMQSTTLSGRTPAVGPAAAASAPLPMTDTLGPVSNVIITHPPFSSVIVDKTTAFVTDTTEEEDSVTATSSITPSVMTTLDSPTAAATTDSHSTVSNTVVTTAKTASLAPKDTTMAEHSITTTSKATTTSHAGSIASNTTVFETTSTSSTTKMHSESTSSSSPAVAFTSYVTAAWKTTKKSDSALTSSRTTNSLVKPTQASSTPSVPMKESTTTSSDTAWTNKTTSAIPPSSTTATTQGGVKTTASNAKTSKLASTASSEMKASSITSTASTTTTPSSRSTTATTTTTTAPSTTKTDPEKCPGGTDNWQSTVPVALNTATNRSRLVDAIRNGMKKWPLADQKSTIWKHLLEGLERAVWKKPSTISTRTTLTRMQGIAQQFWFATWVTGANAAISDPKLVCDLVIPNFGTLQQFADCIPGSHLMNCA